MANTQLLTRGVQLTLNFREQVDFTGLSSKRVMKKLQQLIESYLSGAGGQIVSDFQASFAPNDPLLVNSSFNHTEDLLKTKPCNVGAVMTIGDITGDDNNIEIVIGGYHVFVTGTGLTVGELAERITNELRAHQPYTFASGLIGSGLFTGLVFAPGDWISLGTYKFTIVDGALWDPIRNPFTLPIFDSTVPFPKKGLELWSACINAAPGISSKVCAVSELSNPENIYFIFKGQQIPTDLFLNGFVASAPTPIITGDFFQWAAPGSDPSLIGVWSRSTFEGNDLSCSVSTDGSGTIAWTTGSNLGGSYPSQALGYGFMGPANNGAFDIEQF